MNQKLSTIDTKPEPKTETAAPNAGKKRRLRRQTDLGLVTGPGPSFLLSHEDPVCPW